MSTASGAAGHTIAAPQALHLALRQALRRAARPEADAAFEPLPDTGLAHLHLRLAGAGLLLRCPKQSQMNLDASSHLRYEAACFERAAPSGHTPRLHAVLPPAPDLPRGALLVDAVEGRPVQLPRDLAALSTTLAALHRLPLPARSQRAPLLAPAHPVQALAAEIETQAALLPQAGLDPRVRHILEGERERLQRLAAGAAAPPVSLISFDAHPGNYVVRSDGRAVLVDLEKARYGPPPLDLAHATLYTSTTWDVASHAVLDDVEVLDFHRSWLAQMPDGDAQRPWIAPLRRAMWLWSLTWCAKWRVQAAQAPGPSGDGEDWSAALSEQALVDHVRERVDHYLDPDVVASVQAGIERLAEALR